jgi:hypothetical protein
MQKRDRQNRKDRTRQAEQERHNGRGRTGKTEQDRQNRKDRQTEQGFRCTVLKPICFVTVFFNDKYVW